MPNKVILRRASAIWVLAIGLACVCDWLYWHAYESGRLRHELYAQSLIPLLVIASAMAVFALLREIYLRAVVGSFVEVSNSGITDNASKRRVGFIPWADIETLEILKSPLAATVKIGFRSGLRQEPLLITPIKVSDEAERTIKYLQLEANSRRSKLQ